VGFSRWNIPRDLTSGSKTTSLNSPIWESQSNVVGSWKENVDPIYIEFIEEIVSMFELPEVV
jgi:hypothetical protein